MKLFWKLFISLQAVILLMFTVFGCFLMYFSFENSINREKERSREETLFFQYALLTSMESLPDSYQAYDMAAAEIAETIQNNVANSNNIVRVYNSRRQIVFESEPRNGSLLESGWEDHSGVSRIVKQEDGFFIETFLEVTGKMGTYYLEIDKNITYIYSERDMLLSNYKLVLLAAFLASMFLTFLLSAGFTRSIRRLSIETRWFADGNYKRRVAVRGNDEITELMKSFNHMANELEKTMNELEEDARRQEDFTAAFAHELKTPLTSVIGYADMLRSRNLSDEERRLSADYIFGQGKRLERLSYKLMELVGMRTDEIRRQEIDVQELAEKIKKFTAQVLRKKKITFYVSVAPGNIYGDIDLLQSLLGNLIDNARKACSEGGIIWMMGEPEDDGYRFFVQDNGRGIPEEEIYKITEAFYMVDKSRARKEGGAGIGMTLCKRIIELHGADWKISSAEGQGTRVTVHFKEDGDMADA